MSESTNVNATTWVVPVPATAAPKRGALAVVVALGIAGTWFASLEQGLDADDSETFAAPPEQAPAPAAHASALADLGRTVFFDTNLSEPAGTSCASCHDPAHAFAGENGSALGVARGSRPGHFARRATPSVLYLGLVRPFHFHWEEDAPLPDAFGGYFWDGRVDSLAALFSQPALNPDEMANRDLPHLAAKLQAAPYAAELGRVLGPLASPEAIVRGAGEAVEAFLLSDAMSPFTSKYDDYIRGRVALTPQEAHGLALFKDDARGGCSGCHKLVDNSPDPRRSPFSDYGFETVAVPRNRRLLPGADGDAKRFDLGLCERADAQEHTSDPRFCGAFRTPSLRNVATRSSFMHNGAFTTLRDVVAFYATRGTNPERWYPGGVYDDLPAKYRANVNDRVVPYDRRPGDPPALDEGEIDAIVAFLGTLTDAQYR
jgi:cytochrome c peroxidase